eukprot:Gb_06766 [translate_table: standard]
MTFSHVFVPLSSIFTGDFSTEDLVGADVLTGVSIFNGTLPFALQSFQVFLAMNHIAIMFFFLCYKIIYFQLRTRASRHGLMFVFPLEFSRAQLLIQALDAKLEAGGRAQVEAIPPIMIGVNPLLLGMLFLSTRMINGEEMVGEITWDELRPDGDASLSCDFMVWTPNVVTVWEAGLTLLQFGLLMLHAYVQDKGWRYLSIPLPKEVRPEEWVPPKDTCQDGNHKESSGRILLDDIPANHTVDVSGKQQVMASFLLNE